MKNQNEELFHVEHRITVNLLEEYKTLIKRLQIERDIYRQRAIDEVADHHNTTHQMAAFDVDGEVLQHLQGVAS